VPARVKTAAEIERIKPNSIFQSGSDRFEHCYSAKQPGIRVLDSTKAPRKKIVSQNNENKHIFDK